MWYTKGKRMFTIRMLWNNGGNTKTKVQLDIMVLCQMTNPVFNVI